MKNLFRLLPALLLVACSSPVEATFDIIPRVESICKAEGDGFAVNFATKVVYPVDKPELAFTAQMLGEWLGVGNVKAVKSVAEAKNNVIVLDSSYDCDNAEAYTLTVNSKRVALCGASAAGVFYGAQTLRKAAQTVAAEGERVSFPAVNIVDAPRFCYRGAHLDEARHFFGAEFVKRYIDILALHNINTFHWHLTDDQGWRIEIKRYPELTTIGSIREQTIVGDHRVRPERFDGTPYGGFYTQEEIKEVVAYAAKRHITIIPEVDLPGHMMAALTAYPELGCTGGPYKLRQTWGIEPDVLCAGNEKTFELLEGVLTEVMVLFPSKYIHIGGDECPKARWEKCPKCQAKIRELRLRDEGKKSAEMKLQSYVMDRVGKFLAAHGRSFIGWDEILEGGLADNATVMSWRSVEAAFEAARMGHDAILTPRMYMYLDYYQTESHEGEPMANSPRRSLPIEKVYSLNPTPEEELTPEQAAHIIGVQANLWTEYVKTGEHVEHMLLPRLAAACEVQWCNGERDYAEFYPRLELMRKVYDRYGYNYAKYAFVSAETAEKSE